MARTRGKRILNFEVTEEEGEQVRENAAFFGMSQAEFLRHVALGGTIDWRDKALRKKAWTRRKEMAA